MTTDYLGTERRKNNGEHICQKEDVIDDISNDIGNVKNDINTIKNDKVHTNELLGDITKQLASIDKRLFVDNGTLSIQTQLITGAARMSQIEYYIKNTDTQIAITNKQMNDKIEEVKNEPRKYAIYTVGFLTVLSMLFGAILWISTHTLTPTPQYIYQQVPMGSHQPALSQIPTLTRTEK